MWDLPGPGLELVSPALAGRFSTTSPPGESLKVEFDVVDLKTKTASYFTSKICLFGNNRELQPCYSKNYRLVQQTKERKLLYREKGGIWEGLL